MAEARAPRVSAIIIVFNGEKYLAEAIESVIAQTMADWELIVVDDGSTDRSRAIAREYAARLPHKIFSIAHGDRANHGMSATRNRGIAAARGAFIGFLDCDDVWEPQKLDEQLAVMAAHPTAGMIYGRTLIWHSWKGGSRAADYYYSLGVPAGALYQPPRLLATLLANTGQTPTTCNALMRADLIAAIGGFEVDFRGMFEDQVFFAKAMLAAPTYVDGRTWAKYRQHSESFSARTMEAQADQTARLRFLGWLAAYVLRRYPGRIGVEARIAREVARIYARRGRRWLRALLKGVSL